MDLEYPTWPTSFGMAIAVGVSEVVKYNGPDPSGFDRDAEERLVATKFTSPYSLQELRYFHEIKQQFGEQGILEFLNPDEEPSPATSTHDQTAAIDVGVKSICQVTPLVFKRPIEPAIGGAAASSSSSSGIGAQVGDPLAELSRGHVLKRPRKDLVSTEESVIENLNPATDSSSEAATGAVVSGSIAEVGDLTSREAFVDSTNTGVGS